MYYRVRLIGRAFEKRMIRHRFSNFSEKAKKRKRIFLGFPNPERMPFQENRKNFREQGGYDTIYFELGFRKWNMIENRDIMSNVSPGKCVGTGIYSFPHASYFRKAT